MPASPVDVLAPPLLRRRRLLAFAYAALHLGVKSQAPVPPAARSGPAGTDTPKP